MNKTAKYFLPMLLSLAFVLLCGIAAAGEIKVIPSPQKTSNELGLDFVCESVEIIEEILRIKGTITNTDDNEYKYVSVIFTIKDNNGIFIDRDDRLADPHRIGSGEVGYITIFFDLRGKKPALVEYSVVGRER